jgi:hypothetical protein
MRIRQVRFSEHIRFFAEAFMLRWGLRPYTDPSLPALFMGCYDDHDRASIASHQSLRICILTGGGSRIDGMESPTQLHFVNHDDSWSRLGGLPGFRRKNLRIPIKSFAEFKPVHIGDSIYIYMGNGSDEARMKHGGEHMPDLIRFFGKRRIIEGVLGNSIEHMRRDIYPHVAVNLHLNPVAGFTTSTELAYMGRKSVSNYTAPWCMQYADTRDIISHCIREIERQGEPAQSLVPANYWHESEDWLNSWYYGD